MPQTQDAPATYLKYTVTPQDGVRKDDFAARLEQITSADGLPPVEIRSQQRGNSTDFTVAINGGSAMANEMARTRIMGAVDSAGYGNLLGDGLSR